MADLTYWKGNRSPSITGTISVDGVPFDLTGSSVKFRLRLEGSSSLAIDEAAAIVTPLAGTVRYDPSASFAALAAGDYVAWWQVTLPSTKTQDSPEFSLVIIDHAPLTRSLCELEDVVQYAPGYRSDPRTDSVLEEMILAESYSIMQMTGREFKPIASLNPRKFDVGRGLVNFRTLRVGDLAVAPTAVRLYDLDQTTLVQTIAAPAWVAQPRNRAEWEPITSLLFPPSASSAPVFAVGQVVEIDATAWGFPSIPADVREACARLVVYRYVVNTPEGSAFSESLAGVDVGALFASGRSTLLRYTIPGIA